MKEIIYFTVYHFNFLSDSVTVSTTAVSIGTIIYNVSVTDNENDQIFYSMDCTPTGGPFNIYNCKWIVPQQGVHFKSMI